MDMDFEGSVSNTGMSFYLMDLLFILILSSENLNAENGMQIDGGLGGKYFSLVLY